VTGIQEMLGRQEVGAATQIQDVQRVTGRLMSMMLAYSGVRVFTRGLYQVIARALEENETRRQQQLRPVYQAQLTAEALEELRFWKERLLSHNGLEINCRETQVQVVLWSDASDVGYGGEAAAFRPSSLGLESEFQGEAGGVVRKVAKAELPAGNVSGMEHGWLPRGEIARSSTRRELVALLMVARAPRILSQIRGMRIRVVMDSIPALRNLIKGGGPKPELCKAVKEWVEFCERENIRPTYEWVPRAENWRADEASKLQSQQHTLVHGERSEERIRKLVTDNGSTERLKQQVEKRANHFKYGKVAVFTPMFHQVDARVEMIRSQLEDAIIVVPRWPAGGKHDWYRRVVDHSIARIKLGTAAEWYREKPRSGHNDVLEAFWLTGRRGEGRMKPQGADASCVAMVL
jgi:hypothetical protein